MSLIKHKISWKRVLNFWLFIIGIVILVLCFDTYGGKGILYFVLGMLALAILQVAMKWQMVMAGMRSIEEKLFGKPLDKEFWQGDEKVKFRWVKENGTDRIRK